MNAKQRTQAIYAINEFATITRYFEKDGQYCALGAMAKVAGLKFTPYTSSSFEGCFWCDYDDIMKAYGLTSNQCSEIANINNRQSDTIIRRKKVVDYIMSLPLEEEKLEQERLEPVQQTAQQ